METREPLEILMIDDNAADVDLVRECLQAAEVPPVIHVARDGIQALELVRSSHSSDKLCPHVILLDLNLPRKSGRQVLGELKSDPDLCRIPVVVFTSSRAAYDIEAAYEAHANCYVAKPDELPEFMDVVMKLHDFWRNVAQLPT